MPKLVKEGYSEDDAARLLEPFVGTGGKPGAGCRVAEYAEGVWAGRDSAGLPAAQRRSLEALARIAPLVRERLGELPGMLMSTEVEEWKLPEGACRLGGRGRRWVAGRPASTPIPGRPGAR